MVIAVVFIGLFSHGGRGDKERQEVGGSLPVSGAQWMERRVRGPRKAGTGEWRALKKNPKC